MPTVNAVPDRPVHLRESITNIRQPFKSHSLFHGRQRDRLPHFPGPREKNTKATTEQQLNTEAQSVAGFMNRVTQKR